MKKIKISLVFTLSINLLSYSQISEREVTEYAINNIKEFVEFLSYPNDANYKEDIEELIDWTSKRFNSLGFKSKRLETESIPLLLAESVYNKNYNTILIYLHLDGQPVDKSKWFQDDPFKPVLKRPNSSGEYRIIDWENLNNKTLKKLDNEDIRIFARSSSDAKGPVMMLINALEIMSLNNLAPKFNIKLIMDFE